MDTNELDKLKEEIEYCVDGYYTSTVLSHLDDISKIYEDKIAELEANQAKRELEMKAKGVFELSDSMLFRGYLENTLSRDEVIAFARKLTKQAGDL